MTFTVGQRWVSQTESDLGLGLITDVSGRRVTIAFPAAEEERTYAMENAPLARVRYRVGETLRDRHERPLTVCEVEDSEGLFTYECEDEAGEPVTLTEVMLSPHARFVHPEQRLFCGQFDRNGDFELRYATLQHQAQLQASPVRGLLGTRTRLLPHQIAIADQTARRPHPRVLLADEAGLGKTIEAGLVLHRQVLTGQARRILVLVPDALLTQWFVEMRRRFNLHFALFDQERLKAESEGNPFESEQFVLAPLSLLSGDEATLEQAVGADWDLLVVDEAHHLHWSPEGADAGYRAVEQLAGAIPGVLLLTATPEQVGLDSHFARLRLIDPARFNNFPAFQEEVRAHGGLPEQHRLLFRHTRADVGGFPERVVEPEPLEADDSYRAAVPFSDHAGLFPETALDGDTWLDQDPRVSWLERTLKAYKSEKVLVLCGHAQTAETLEHYLQLRAGIRSAAFHEGLSIIERDRAAAWFADEEQGAQALICSEIGGEGRNFQFAHRLVLFDLPANPDLLEQRIGRLDRIGQGERIHLHVPYITGSAQEVLFRWYHEGLNALAAYCPTGVAVQQAVAGELEEALAHPEQAPDALLAATGEARDRLEKELADEQATFATLTRDEKESAEARIAEIEEADEPEARSAYLARLFDQYGIHYEAESDAHWIVRPTDHMKIDQFPHLPDEGLSLALNRDTALAREDLAFASWEHPLVREGMSMVLDSELGNAALITLELKSVPAGTLMLEAIHRISTAAPASVPVGRFLPLAPGRLLLTGDGRDLSEMLDHDKLSAIGGRIKRKDAHQILPQLRDNIEALLPSLRTRTQEGLPETIANARQELEAHYNAEIEALRNLQATSDELKDNEIQALEQQRDQGVAAIERATVELEGLRVVLTT
ncbi:RNA polymerase-associated protein RapA [Vreelandella utahensis]|uniref:RNA polymerase-associated protein RapA n=1 Tax=Vreelandella halophila TaxID=86177 RepID=UPI000984B011|nr:RNA polymerase-associated protein RapA [Halomonas utahensis]